MLEGGEPKSKMKSGSEGMRAMRSMALGARRREEMRVRLSCWVFTVVFVGGVRVKFVEGEEEVGRERTRVERRVVRRMGVVVVVYMFAAGVMRREGLIGWEEEVSYKGRNEKSRVASKHLLLTTKRRIVGRGNSVGFSICKLKPSLLLLLLLKIQTSSFKDPLRTIYSVNITTTTSKPHHPLLLHHFLHHLTSPTASPSPAQNKMKASPIPHPAPNLAADEALANSIADILGSETVAQPKTKIPIWQAKRPLSLPFPFNLGKDRGVSAGIGV